jgi:uncharacterized membrane protein
MNNEQLARGLGWFSIGLGLAELLAPREVGRLIGIPDHRNHRKTFQTMGLREISAGVGILSSEKPTGWMWSRVAGDALDLSLLGAALNSDHHERGKVMGAIAAVAGVTALDVLCAIGLGEEQMSSNGYPRSETTYRATSDDSAKLPVRKSITINKPAEEIYRFWRNFENLPKFMNHLISVTTTDERRSHWVAKGPARTQVSWDAELTQDIPNELIGWKSTPGSTIQTAGTVSFETATGGRGTIVRVELQYRPPAGKLGATIAKLFGEAPEGQIPVDLQRIKSLLETGEIPRTEGQSAGRAKSTSRRYDDLVRT